MTAKHANPSPRRLWLRLSLVSLVLVGLFVMWSDARLRAAFAGRDWQQPAKVYARPLILATGVALSIEDLTRELESLGYAPDPGLQRPGSYYRRGKRMDIHLRGFHLPDGPSKPGRYSVLIDGGMLREVATGDGRPMEELVLEPPVIGGIYPGMDEDRLLVRLEDTPRLLVEALLLVEDRDFYQHGGLSLRGIGRALMANIRAGRTVQGGSTLTQQLIKNVALSRERSLWRKIQEAVMALLLESRYSKDDILELYLNEVYLGQEGSRAIHGFALAARHYFNKPLSELDMAQVAMLVGLVKGPSLYDPWRRPERVIDRRNVVLALLAEAGWMNSAQLEVRQQSALALAKSSAMAGVYPAYLDLVRRQLRRDYRNEDLRNLGLKVFTPFDPRVQREAESALRVELQKLGEKHEELEAALVVMDARSADIVALVGGRKPRYAGFNRALDALRPIGSLAKPAVYLTALQLSDRYRLNTFIDDAAVSWADPDTGVLWQPQNYDRQSHGKVMLVEALAKSYNQAAARLGLELGAVAVRDTFRQLGVTRPIPALPALFLGAVSLSPLEVATMFQTIAAEGQRMLPRSIYAVAGADGKLLARYPQRPATGVDPRINHLMKYTLQQAVREGTGRGVYRVLPKSFTVAGKTGTTNDLRDSWFAGFAGDYLAVAWMGRDDNAPAGLTGSSGALKVWRNFIARASREPMPFVPPPGLQYQWIDAETGLLSEESCASARFMPFLKGTAPRRRSGCSAASGGFSNWFRSILN